MTGFPSFRARLYDPFLFFPLRKLRREVAEFLWEYRNSRILDLCCGTGYQLKLLARKGFSDLHCLDFSEEMLKIARKRGRAIRIYQADAIDTGFENGSFDVVVLSFALHEKDTVTARAVIAEAGRILKSTGRLLVVDFLFDEKTGIAARLGITAVEKMAGGEHYRNFRNYMCTGGLLSLMDGTGFLEIRRGRAVAGGTVITMYRKPGV